MDVDAVWDAGWNAFFKGEPEEGNPYHVKDEQELYLTWFDGWSSAYMEDPNTEDDWEN